MGEEISNRPVARGVYAALLTPRRTGSMEADAAALLEYLDVVASAGVDGLVLFGSTGEFIHFDLEERARVASLAIKRSRLPVLVNTSHSSLPGAISLAESAADAGAAGLLLMPPHFYRYSDDQIFAFYEHFLESLAGDLPVYLYHLPMYVNPITPALAKRLFETGGFAGVKDSSGEWANFEALRTLREKHAFQLLMGNESIYVDGRSKGADGTVSGVAACLPELLVALDRSISNRDGERVRLLSARLLEFVAYVNRFPATVAIRQAAVARGWNFTQTAVPLDEDLAADVITFHQWCCGWLPTVLSESQAALAMRT